MYVNYKQADGNPFLLAIARPMSSQTAVRGLVVTDCDGCLTDGTVGYHDNNIKSRSFSVVDGHGFYLLKEHGFDVIILSGENDNNIKHRAEKLGVQFLYSKGIKIDTLKHFIERHYIVVPDIYVLGDDVGDLSLFDYSIMNATPKNSFLAKRMPERVNIILSRSGGNGAFREFAEEVLSANGVDPYASFR